MALLSHLSRRGMQAELREGGRETERECVRVREAPRQAVQSVVAHTHINGTYIGSYEYVPVRST